MFKFEKDMSIIEVLNGTKKDIKANIDLLAKDYLKKTGRKVCRTCPSDIQYMILSLKNYYKMTQFKFKKPFGMYKNKKGDKTIISNATMTDGKAIEFLKTNPKRIELFSEYPSNWKKLIEGKAETEDEKAERLAAEAELQAKKDSESDKEKPEGEKPEGENLKPSRENLMKMSLKDLREKYPEIKATSIKDFVDKVLA